MKQGILLINLGTPAAPTTRAVRTYLKDFLSDKRVINLPLILRYFLLYGFILPFRPKRSASAYQKIWTDEGSPLLVYSKQLVEKLQQKVSQDCKVVLGMRYGEPSIKNALQQLSDCEQITIIPLYPQYSSAATGSSIEKTMQELLPQDIFPSIHIIRDFYQHPDYIETQANLIKPYLNSDAFVLFSYHGIPENQILTGPCKNLCKKTCSKNSPQYAGCYRSQCHQTTALLANHLGLKEENYLSAFQSRLGKTKWIEPYTDQLLNRLRARGIENLIVACPSFVTDCLETLEEIGMRLREQWLAIGGTQMTLVPSLNANDEWVNTLISIANTPTFQDQFKNK